MENTLRSAPSALRITVLVLAGLLVAAIAVVATRHGAPPIHPGAYLLHGAKPDYLLHG